MWRRVLAVSPRPRDVCETTDWTVCEASVDHFKVPLCTQTLNTTWGRSDHVTWLFLNTDWTRIVVTLFSAANSFGGSRSSRISLLEEEFPATHTPVHTSIRVVA